MRNLNKFLSIVVVVAILATATNMLARKGYRYALKRNNSYSAGVEFQKFYRANDSSQTCRKIVTGVTTTFTDQQVQDCKQRLDFKYGFPLHYQHIDYRVQSDWSRPLFIVNFVLIIFVYLLPIPLTLFILRKIFYKKHSK